MENLRTATVCNGQLPTLAPSNHLPINHYLKCSEEWIQPGSQACDEDDGMEQFRFYVTLPPSLNSSAAGKRLTFYSRERSSGTGVVTPDDGMTELETIHDGPLDPHFFERGFYLEAKTGFQVWPGSRLLLQALLCEFDIGSMPESAFGRLKYWQGRLKSSTPLNIIELGAGIGVVGTSLAASGGHVLMTDLNVLVDHGLRPNLVRNENEDCRTEDQLSCSPFLTSMLPSEECEDISPRPISIGCGHVRPTVLDWFKPINSQLSFDAYSNVNLIVACDCIFLRKLVDPMFETIGELFCNAKSEEVRCLFTYQRRNLMGVFIPLEEVLERIHVRGWSVQCLAWRKVQVEDDGEHELFLFEISNKNKIVDGTSANALAMCEEKKE